MGKTFLPLEIPIITKNSEAISNEKTSSQYLMDISDTLKPRYIKFIDYWKRPLDFGYFCLLIPFRLKLSKESGKLEIYSCRFQQVLCAVVQAMLFFEYVSLFLSTYWEASGDSNTSYFTPATYIGYMAYHLSLNFTFWFKRKAFQSVFVQMQNLKFYATESRRRSELFIKLMSFCFCPVMFLMALTDSSLVNNFYAHGGSLEKFYEYLSQKAQLQFVFLNKEGDESESGESCFFLPILITFIRIVILLPSLLLVPFLDLFVLIIPFSMWQMMCAFEKLCKHSAGSPLVSEKTLEKYWMIKKLLQDLNRAIGLLLCCCISVSLPYYAAFTGVTYFEKNMHPIMLLHVYGFFLIFFIALTFAADINKKGSEFYSWISSPENSKEIPSNILTSLLVDLHSNQIALKGNGFFQISYRFLGTIFGVIVTYSIITIQIQLSRKGLDRNGGIILGREELPSLYCNCSI